VLVIIAGGLGVKWAFDHDVLPPLARVMLGIVLGIGVIAVGVRFIRRDMRALGQGLVGMGIGILYVSTFAGLAHYEVYPQYIAFGLLLLTTAGGMVLAVKFDAIPIAFLALFGGFLTPIMVSSGHNSRDALFTYILLLDLGVLGVAFFKRWRALDVLAFLCTWGYFFGWFWKYYSSAPAPVAATAWVCVFFAVFLVQPFAFHLKSKMPVTGERFAASVLNAFVAFAFVYAILGGEHTTAHGLVVLAMSAGYLGLGSVIRSRIVDDVRATFAFLALALTGFVVAVPILLEFHGVTAAWAAQAPLILYLAYRYSYYPARLASLVPLVLAAGRIFVFHWWRHDEPFTPVFNAEFMTSILVVLAGWGYAFVHHHARKDSRPEERALKIAFGLASAFLALALVHADVWQWLDVSGSEASARWATSLVWTGGAAALFICGMILKSFHARVAGFGALAVSVALLVMDFSAGFREGSTVLLNGRFFAAAAAVVVLFAWSIVCRRRPKRLREEECAIGVPLHAIGILALTLAASVESWQWLVLGGHPYAARVVLVFVWLAGAGAYLVSGFRLGSAYVRGAGLIAAIVAAVSALVAYGSAWPEGIMVFVNWRFVAGAAVALWFAAHALVTRRRPDICSANEIEFSVALYAAAMALGAVLASLDAWGWFASRGSPHLGRAALVAVWSVCAAGWLGAAIRLRSTHLRAAGLVPMALAMYFTSMAFWAEWPWDGAIFVNWRFVACAAVPVVLFAYARLVVRPDKDAEDEDDADAEGVAARLKAAAAELNLDEQSVSTGLYGVGILAAILILSAETWLWLDGDGLTHSARAAVAFVWALGALAYLGAALRLASGGAVAGGMRKAAFVALGVSAVVALVSYGYRYPATSSILVNWRFASALATAAAAFAVSLVFRRRANPKDASESSAPLAVHGAAILFLTVVTSLEVRLLLGHGSTLHLARCLVPAVWVAGAAAFLASGARLASARLRAAGVMALGLGFIFAAWNYGEPIEAGYMMYANGRFAAMLAVIVMGLVHGHVLRRKLGPTPPSDIEIAKPLYGLATVSLLIFLSVESYVYFPATMIGDVARAKTVANASLTVVWALSAMTLLGVGFWKRARAIRLGALALFAVTAMKLLAFDMKKVTGGWRIASVLLVGLLIIGASYLYHRIERWVDSGVPGTDGDEDDLDIG
jgi:uncharacterized membrane protein